MHILHLLIQLTGTILSLLGSLILMLFLYLSYHQGFGWTFDRMIVRPWRLHRLMLRIRKLKEQRDESEYQRLRDYAERDVQNTCHIYKEDGHAVRDSTRDER